MFSKIRPFKLDFYRLEVFQHNPTVNPFKVTNDEMIESEVQAAPIPLIETASIPLPLQNFSDIIDDLNVGTIPLHFLNDTFDTAILTLNPPEESSGDDSVVIMNRSATVILTPVCYWLFYCQI